MMKLPNLSSMVQMGRLRYIQAAFEPPALRNPDVLAKKLLPLRERLMGLIQGTIRLSRLRANPLYYYLLARTRYYDQVFVKAIERDVSCIINIGCGSDTRAHRFQSELAAKNVMAVEMDQAQAIAAKRAIASRQWPKDRVSYAPIDLNASQWPELARILRDTAGTRVQVIMEGVSPYVDQEAFRQFLAFVSDTLAPGSQIAYDFKIKGVDDQFGSSANTLHPFRLAADRALLEQYHAAVGLHLLAFEPSSALAARLVPGIPQTATAPFTKDALVQLEVDRARD